MSKKIDKTVFSYEQLYPKRSVSNIFCRADSYWNDSYGAQFDVQANSKIVVFGLPKSGNTYLVSLLAECLDLNIIDPLEEVSSCGVGMTHRPMSPMIADRGDIIHGLVLLRDLRDIIASFFEYTQTESFKKARPEFHYSDIDSFYYDWFLSRIDQSLKVKNFVAEYASFGVPVVRFEKLIYDPLKELKRIFKCLGLDVKNEKILEATKKLDFSNLKKKGIQFGKIFIPKTHFPIGQAKRYSRTLNKKILLDIQSRYADFFNRWGYT